MKDKSILVSFCNLPKPTKHPILRLNIPQTSNEPINTRPIKLGHPKPISSATGLTANMNNIFALYWAKNKFYVAALKRKDLSPLYQQELPEIKDGHSILASETQLFVVSTGTDEVIRYYIQDKKLANPEVIWRASSAGTDTHHMNSIIKIGREIYISAFGLKTGELWASASNGYIHNITSDVRVKEGIYHPHSLSEKDGMLYYCESSTRSFCSLDKTILKLEGYTRGIGWLTDDLVCISSSMGRKISKSTGLIANSADPGELDGKSGITIMNIKTKEVVSEANLAGYGPEIYDVLVFDQ